MSWKNKILTELKEEDYKRFLKQIDMNIQEQNDSLQEQEYKQRKFWFVFEFKGRINSGVVKVDGVNFNPRHTEATREQFDKILDCIIDAGESEFKLIGTHEYKTLKELNKHWK